MVNEMIRIGSLTEGKFWWWRKGKSAEFLWLVDGWRTGTAFFVFLSYDTPTFLLVLSTKCVRKRKIAWLPRIMNPWVSLLTLQSIGLNLKGWLLVLVCSWDSNNRMRGSFGRSIVSLLVSRRVGVTFLGCDGRTAFVTFWKYRIRFDF